MLRRGSSLSAVRERRIEYEQTLKDIKNGLLVSKSVDGDTECMTTFNPNWVGSTTD